ncbi:MAG: hypothetical protein JXX14_12075, partial [Deltaproteobacteria bacterium]|nr:hypothetical protein [Deltaproteobacteria bacterium]
VNQSGQVHLGAAVYPLLPALPRLQPVLQLAIDRFIWDDNAPFVTESRFQAIPMLTVPLQNKLFWSDIRLGALLQRRQFDQSGSGQSRMLPGVMMRAGVPLIKNGRRRQHLMQPTVSFKIAALQRGHAPLAPVDIGDIASAGTHLALAIDNLIGKKVYQPDFTFTPAIHWLSFQSGSLSHTPLYHLDVTYRRNWFRTGAAAAMNSQTQRVSSARLTLAIDDNTFAGYSAALFYSARNANSDATFFPGITWIWPIVMPRFTETNTLLNQQLRLQLTERIRLMIDAQFELNPGIRLSALYYELEAATPCRCIVASITAAHRPGYTFPDAMLNLSWRPDR